MWGSVAGVASCLLDCGLFPESTYRYHKVNGDQGRRLEGTYDWKRGSGTTRLRLTGVSRLTGIGRGCVVPKLDARAPDVMTSRRCARWRTGRPGSAASRAGRRLEPTVSQSSSMIGDASGQTGTIGDGGGVGGRVVEVEDKKVEHGGAQQEQARPDATPPRQLLSHPL
jgi:hypothetical protein